MSNNSYISVEKLFNDIPHAGEEYLASVGKLSPGAQKVFIASVVRNSSYIVSYLREQGIKD